MSVSFSPLRRDELWDKYCVEAPEQQRYISTTEKPSMINRPMKIATGDAVDDQSAEHRTARREKKDGLRFPRAEGLADDH